MSLKKIIKFRQSLAFRLTLWYAAIFTISISVAFVIFYYFINTLIRDQVDRDLLGKINTFSTVFSLKGGNAVIDNAIIEAQAAGEKKIFFRLLDISGQVFSSSNMYYWEDIKVDKEAIFTLLRKPDYIFKTISVTSRKHKVRILYGYVYSGTIMQIGQSMENSTRVIEIFKKAFLLTMIGLVLFAALIGWFMAKRALTGVWQVTRTARQISDGSLDERVPVKTGGDEIDQLAITFNEMLDRIQKLIISTKEMSDNIAHDLRSHVTRIRGGAEIALTTGGSIDEFQKMAGGTVEECDQLLEMINTMLIISKTESGIEDINFVTMDIVKIVKSACELFKPMAENKDLTLTFDAKDEIMFKGDISMVQRMISNLLDNAIKYSHSGGDIQLSVMPENETSVIISIADRGIGIAGSDLSHIFERFYRCDPSRSQSGSGLGLSLARAIAVAHGGNISVESIEKKGSTFTISLPISKDKL